MKDKGYQVIKGRGISFIDDKKVKIKGSEVNYSLRNIERMLDEQKVLDSKHSVYSSRLPYSSNSSSQHSATFRTGHDYSKEVSKDLSEIIDVLIKPTQTIGAPDEAASQHKFKKKRKRSRRHL